MASIVAFPGTTSAPLAQVGGKAWSLIRLSEAGFPVPPGAVLTTEFFAPWFEEIRASATWGALSSSDPEKWPELCRDLKQIVGNLALDPAQAQAFAGLQSHLASTGTDGLWAVRSSSPDEDLAAASFAGGYETTLGVDPSQLEDAIRRSFASCRCWERSGSTR